MDMDVISDKRVDRLVAAYGTARIYELDDKTWVTAAHGTVSWRNNNPGNLKFEFEGSADKTVHSTRPREKALADAQKQMDGVVDLDQWGNAVFESYEAGRAAEKQYVESRHANHTVEDLVKDYSRADYSGAAHHRAQAKAIHATALAQGKDLRGKRVKDMTTDERNALLDGISRFEDWQAGTVTPTPVMTEDQLKAFKAAYRPDQHVGARTKQAVEAFQATHGLHADGVAGPATLSTISHARRHMLATTRPLPHLLDARHRANGIHVQTQSCVARLDQERGWTQGRYTQTFVGPLTSAATTVRFKRHRKVDVMLVIQTPSAQSGHVSSRASWDKKGNF